MRRRSILSSRACPEVTRDLRPVIARPRPPLATSAAAQYPFRPCQARALVSCHCEPRRGEAISKSVRGERGRGGCPIMGGGCRVGLTQLPHGLGTGLATTKHVIARAVFAPRFIPSLRGTYPQVSSWRAQTSWLPWQSWRLPRRSQTALAPRNDKTRHREARLLRRSSRSREAQSPPMTKSLSPCRFL